MEISVVVATHDQRERTRLVLCGLRCQQFPASCFEVVVVDDGSTDGTRDMLDEVKRQMPIRVVRLAVRRGRCRARNRGVEAARGGLVAFLDGDALPHPGWLQSLWKAYERWGPDCLLCGFERSLPDLEYLQDPRRGLPMEGVTPSVVRDFIQLHKDEMVITEERIADDFDTVHRRSREGGYPFPELKRVQEQTLELFEERPESSVGWIGFYPHNGMVPREAFVRAGGFDAGIPFSEGWDLAYRLQRTGCRPRFVKEAVTYHLYHFHDFSDPARSHDEALKRRQAIGHMMRKYQDHRLILQPFWYAGIWPDPFIPDEMVVPDLLEFDRLYREIAEHELDDFRAIVRRHPAWRGVGEERSGM